MKFLGIMILVVSLLLVLIGTSEAPTAVVTEQPASPTSTPDEKAGSHGYGVSRTVAEANREWLPADSAAPTSGVDTRYRVLGVVDGDTIDVDVDGVRTRVRYIGINTPETVHPTRGTECFGKEASARNQSLVSGQFVRLEKDVSESDKYGRLLRYVYVDDVLVNEVLVAEGYANVSTYPPDVRYTERFRAAEAAARAAGKGLWGVLCEVYQSPSSQEGGAIAPAATGANACTIKGNIAQRTEERIYHVPGCSYYTQTVINEAEGERWFCSEAEAEASGWRKAKNCP
jgi:micrococcal nuclease